MKRHFLFSTLVVLVFGGSTSWAKNPNATRELSGKIAYVSADKGAYRGEEDWRLTFHPDGSKTLRMTNPITDTGIWRDIVQRVDARMRPIDSYQSLWKDGKNRGSAFYWMEGSRVNVVANSPNGTLEQSIEVPEKFSIATRPQASFSWHLWYYDFEKKGPQTTNIFVIDREGLGVGSILGEMNSLTADLIGEEALTTKAGRFDTWKFQMGSEYVLWVDKKDFLTVRLDVPKKNRTYELVELRESFPR